MSGVEKQTQVHRRCIDKNRQTNKDWTNDWTLIQPKLTKGCGASGERWRNTGGESIEEIREGTDKQGKTLETGQANTVNVRQVWRENRLRWKTGEQEIGSENRRRQWVEINTWQKGF